MDKIKCTRGIIVRVLQKPNLARIWPILLFAPFFFNFSVAAFYSSGKGVAAYCHLFGFKMGVGKVAKEEALGWHFTPLGQKTQVASAKFPNVAKGVSWRFVLSR